MDGAIPAFGADSVRRLTARFNLSSGASGSHSLQSGLFEQLLSAPPPIYMDRQSFSSNANHANLSIHSPTVHDRDSEATNAAHRSDGDERQDVQSDDDEQSEQSAVIAQSAALSASPVAAPLLLVDEGDPGEAAANGAAQAEANAEEAGVSHSGDVARGDSTLEEISAQAPTIGADAQRLRQDTLAGGVEKTAPVGNATEVQAGDRDTALNPTTETAGVEPESQVPLDQRLSLQATEAAAGDTEALEPSSEAVEEERIAQEPGDEQLRHPRAQASDEESVPLTGARSQAGARAEETPADGGKSRDNRREKWFQRDADDSNAARSPGNGDGKSASAQGGTTAEKLSAGSANAQSGMLDAAMGEGSDNGSPAVESTAAQMMPDTLPQVQPPTVMAASMASDRLSALENVTSGGAGGERHAAQGNAVDGMETSQRPSGTQRTDYKPETLDAQRPDMLTQAEKVRLVQRVSRSFARLGPMGGQISLKLHPPQLGALNVQVRMEGRSMTAKLTTETGAARDAILESLPVLRTRLAEQGFEISSFQVEVADNQSDATNGSNNPRSGSDLTGGRDDRQAAGQGTDYRRLAAQHRPPSDRHTVSPSSVESSLRAAWELPSGVDVEA